MKYQRFTTAFLVIAALAVPAAAQNVNHVSSYLGDDRWTMESRRTGSLNWKKDPAAITFAPLHVKLKDCPKDRCIVIPKDRITKALASSRSWYDGVYGDTRSAEYLRIYWTTEDGQQAGALFELSRTWRGSMLQEIQAAIAKPIEQERQ